MDFFELRAFLAVADDLHFRRAAEKLHLAQPFVSRTIRALEKDLATPLFFRTTRRVELTPSGRALIEPARAILALSEEARALVAVAREGRSGCVRISFAGPSAQGSVGRLARAVRERHPLIDLDLLPGRYGTTAVAELLQNETDLVLAHFPEPPVGVSRRTVSTQQCVIAVPSTHRLAKADAISLSELRGEPFIAFPEAYGSTVRNILVSHCHAAGFAPTIAQTAPDSWTCVALVSAGVGMHFTLESAVAQLPLEGVEIKRIAEPFPTIYGYLIWRQDDQSLVLRRLLETADDVFPRVDKKSRGALSSVDD